MLCQQLFFYQMLKKCDKIVPTTDVRRVKYIQIKDYQ